MEKLAFSVDEFCLSHGGLCRASFYNMIRQGRGPKIMKVGNRTMISAEAAAEWRREREAVTQQPSAA